MSTILNRILGIHSHRRICIDSIHPATNDHIIQFNLNSFYIGRNFYFVTHKLNEAYFSQPKCKPDANSFKSYK